MNAHLSNMLQSRMSELKCVHDTSITENVYVIKYYVINVWKQN